MSNAIMADGGGKSTKAPTSLVKKPSTNVTVVSAVNRPLNALGLPGINTSITRNQVGTPKLVSTAKPITPVRVTTQADMLKNLGLPDINRTLDSGVKGTPDLLVNVGAGRLAALPNGTGTAGTAKSSTGTGGGTKPTTPTNTEIITTPAASGSSSGSSMVQLSNGDIVRPELMTGKGLADHLGLVYDRAEIEKAMVDAAKAKYANLDNEFGRTQDAYYDSVAGNADMLLGTLRRGDRQAAISGASSGSQAATQLSALLGIGQQNAQGATELAQGRGDLVTKRETEIADAKNKSLKDYNDLGLTLGERISSIYNADMVGFSAEEAARSTEIAARIAQETSNYDADREYDGTKLLSNAQMVASSKYGGGSTSSEPTAAELKNQEIANLMAALSAPGIDKKTAAAYQARLNELMGVTIPTNADVVKPTTGGYKTNSPFSTPNNTLNGGYLQMKDR